MPELTKEQNVVADALIEYGLCEYPEEPYLALAGYAGTGKTTVMGYVGAQLIKNNPSISIAWCAPTGKAASVLKEKLRNFNALNSQSRVNTIHGHIYRLRSAKDGYLDWSKKDMDHNFDLIVVDESSMVTEQMFEDLLSYDKKIIFVGDSGQLPPVGDKVFAPLVDTDLRLSTVHRQALENPIIEMATRARNLEKISYNKNMGGKFIRYEKCSPKAFSVKEMFAKRIMDDDTMILCGINKTRNDINSSIRRKLGFHGFLPNKGERLLCLQNEKTFGLFNGEILSCGDVTPCDGPCYHVYLEGIGNPVAYSGALNMAPGVNMRQKLAEDNNDINKCLEGSFQERPFLFDYGYALSVHKAQGSEWDNVLLYAERTRHMKDEDFARWLYTGITRAKDKLCIIG